MWLRGWHWQGRYKRGWKCLSWPKLVTHSLSAHYKKILNSPWSNGKDLEEFQQTAFTKKGIHFSYWKEGSIQDIHKKRMKGPISFLLQTTMFRKKIAITYDHTYGHTKSQLGMRDFYNSLSKNGTWQDTPTQTIYLFAKNEKYVTFTSVKECFHSIQSIRRTAHGKMWYDTRMQCNTVIAEMARRGQGDISKTLKDLHLIRA